MSEKQNEASATRGEEVGGMLDPEQLLSEYPLTAVVGAFVAGFGATSGLSGLGVRALKGVVGSEQAKRLSALVVPSAKKALKAYALVRIRSIVTGADTRDTPKAR